MWGYLLWHLLILAQRLTSLAEWTGALQLISCRLMGYFLHVTLSLCWVPLTMPRGYWDLSSEQIVLLFSYCLTNIQELGVDWLRLAYHSLSLKTEWRMPGVKLRHGGIWMSKLITEHRTKQMVEKNSEKKKKMGEKKIWEQPAITERHIKENDGEESP